MGLFKRLIAEDFVLWNSVEKTYTFHKAPLPWLEFRYIKIGTALYCPGCYNIMDVQLLPSLDAKVLNMLPSGGLKTQYHRLKCCSQDIDDFQPYRIPLYIE